MTSPAIPTVGDLRRKSKITDAEIEAATAAFLADEATTPGLRRTKVKTAVILGFPVAG